MRNLPQKGSHKYAVSCRKLFFFYDYGKIVSNDSVIGYADIENYQLRQLFIEYIEMTVTLERMTLVVQVKFLDPRQEIIRSVLPSTFSHAATSTLFKKEQCDKIKLSGLCNCLHPK